MSLLLGFVDKFISVDDGDAAPKSRGFLGGILDRFLGRTEPVAPTAATIEPPTVTAPDSDESAAPDGQ